MRPSATTKANQAGTIGARRPCHRRVTLLYLLLGFQYGLCAQAPNQDTMRMATAPGRSEHRSLQPPVRADKPRTILPRRCSQIIYPIALTDWGNSSRPPATASQPTADGAMQLIGVGSAWEGVVLSHTMLTFSPPCTLLIGPRRAFCLMPT